MSQPHKYTSNYQIIDYDISYWVLISPIKIQNAIIRRESEMERWFKIPWLSFGLSGIPRKLLWLARFIFHEQSHMYKLTPTKRNIHRAGSSPYLRPFLFRFLSLSRGTNESAIWGRYGSSGIEGSLSSVQPLFPPHEVTFSLVLLANKDARLLKRDGLKMSELWATSLIKTSKRRTF